MDLFPLNCVLRGFPPSTCSKYASGKNSCAALLSEKISHFSSVLLLCFIGLIGSICLICIIRSIGALKMKR